MSETARKVRTSVISNRAQAAGMDERKFLINLIQENGTQKAIADKLKVSQSAVSQAFLRNGIRPKVVYSWDFEPEAA